MDRRHRTSKKFWDCYNTLPSEVRRLADRQFRLLCSDASHPSLALKPVGRLWSARVGRSFRAVAVADDDELLWVWIGAHDDYEKLIRGS